MNSPGVYAIYGNQTNIFTTIIFDPSKSYITPVTISPITYYLKDAASSVTLPAFTSNRAYMPIVYSLLNSDSTTIDATLFTFTAATRVLTISSSTASKIGVHNLMLKA